VRTWHAKADLKVGTTTAVGVHLRWDSRGATRSDGRPTSACAVERRL